MGGGRGMDMSVAGNAIPPTIEQAGRKTTIAKVDPDLCTGCGVCVDMCPMGAISLRDNTAQVDVQKCTGCGICEDECPVGAISLQ
jgi:NAD-dependent dihydropyrimidine dehydrogenase PreA subunit